MKQTHSLASTLSTSSGPAASAADPLQDTLTDPLQGDDLTARGPDVRQTATTGVSGSAAPLPHLDAIQQSFGKHDVTGVQAHTDASAQQANQDLGSGAYAMGNHVAMRKTDLFTAAHEAAHVVQQQAGAVQADVGQKGDKWEQHANAVAAKVVGGESAEPLLDTVSSGGSTGASSPSVQMLTQPNKKGLSPTSVEYRDTLYSDAAQVADAYYKCIKGIAKRQGGVATCPETALGKQPLMKSVERVEEKKRERLRGGDYGKINDYLRATIVYPSFSKLVAKEREFTGGRATFTVDEKDCELTAVRRKDRMQETTKDVLLNIPFTFNEVTHNVELQLTTTAVQEAKDEAHVIYRQMRSELMAAEDRADRQRKMDNIFSKGAKRAGKAPALGQPHPHETR